MTTVRIEKNVTITIRMISTRSLPLDAKMDNSDWCSWERTCIVPVLELQVLVWQMAAVPEYKLELFNTKAQQKCHCTYNQKLSHVCPLQFKAGS
jgi:hypothetical protein